MSYLDAELRRFVIISDAVSDTVVAKMVEYFKSINAGWCRYLTGGWLVVTRDPKLTSTMLVNKFIEVAPGIDCIAFESRAPANWAFLLKNKELSAGLRTWLSNNWK
jgi:hypothetical protein